MLCYQAMYQQLRLEPYAVHTTFQYGGTEGKRHRLREAMVFYDPPEYYDAPGNIVFSNCLLIGLFDLLLQIIVSIFYKMIQISMNCSFLNSLLDMCVVRIGILF